MALRTNAVDARTLEQPTPGDLKWHPCWFEIITVLV